MEELTVMLNDVKGSYYSFIVAVLNYVKKKESHYDIVKNFIVENPTADTSDILEFIAKQDDFFEGGEYSKVG